MRFAIVKGGNQKGVSKVLNTAVKVVRTERM